MTKEEMVNELFEHIGCDRENFVIITDGEDAWCQYMGDQTGIPDDDPGHEVGRIPLAYSYWGDTLAEWGVESTDEMDEETAKAFKYDVLKYDLDSFL